VLPVACPLRGGAQQVQVELAHDLAVLPGESMERAVAEHEPAAGVGAGFEPLVLQDPLKRPAASGQCPTGLLSGALQRLRHRLAGARRLLDRGQQQIAGEVVPAFRDGDRDLAGCLGVELRRPPGPRPGPPGEPPELHRQQPRLGEPVKVEDGGTARQSERLRDVVPADRRVTAGHVVQQSTADRLVQSTDRRYPVRQRPLHATTLTLRTLDFRGAASRQAFLLLRTVFTLAPILFGLDKFANVLTDWPRYLAPGINDIVPGTAQQAMYAVGVVEILAGIAVALVPRYGALLVAAWLAGIIANLLIIGDYYDVALRDFGLFVAALALARLAVAEDRREGWRLI
jgi:hypothetical protein